MTTAVFGHHPWTVQELVDGVASGRIRLPDIQRPFVWSNTKVRDLIDSMYRGYPVGELMFWANHDAGHTRVIGEGSQDVSMQVVDGQQRLTSLYAVLKGLHVWREDYSRERVAVAFSPIHERFEVPNPSIKGSPDWIPDITAVFDSPIKARQEFLSRYRAAYPDTVTDEEEIELRVNQVHQLQQYQFQVVQLKEQVRRETVADVFVRINSEGVNLSASDFILTWMSVFWEEGRAELEAFARNSRFSPATVTQLDDTPTSWTPHNPFFVVDAGQLVRVGVALGLSRGRLRNAYNALRGRNPRTREIDESARGDALQRLQEAQKSVLNPLHWDEFLKVIERAGFRSSSMVGSINLMLYTYALWLVGRVRFGVAINPLREVMARWLFMSLLTGRYTSSPESAIQDDLNRLEGLDADGPEAFVTTLEALLESAMPDDWWEVSLPEELVTSSKNAPAFVGYLAALNILDAEVLLSPMRVRDWMNPAHRPIKGLEAHHLFPKGYLRKSLGITSTRRTNQVANYALVEWSTNIEISDQSPAEYWEAQCEAKGFSGDRLARQEHLHALPSGWTDLSFEAFLAQRRRLMAGVTRDGYRRLTDPHYAPPWSSVTPPTVEVGMDAMTLEDLVLGGHLQAGLEAVAEDERRHLSGEITEDGALRVGSHVYDSPTQAARAIDADVVDGWSFWTVSRNGDEDRMTLAEVRALARDAAR